MHAAIERALGKAAICPSHDVLASKQAGKPLDALRHQFRMFHHVGGVADDSRDQDTSWRQLDVLPDLPLMLMPRIGRLDHIGAGSHLQDEIDDVLECDVADMRAGPTPPADVIADAILGDAFQSDVERLHEFGEPAAVFVHGRRRDHAVEGVGSTSVIDLQNKPGVDDHLVLDAHRFSDGLSPVVLALVVLVFAVGQHAGRSDHGHEGLLDLHSLERRLEVLDVAPNDILPHVFDRPDTSDQLWIGHGFALVELSIKLLEARTIRARQAGAIAVRNVAQLETAQTFDDVLVPTDRFAELTIARYIDADLSLPADDLGDRFVEARFISRLIVRLPTLFRPHDLLQRLRTDQASNMRRKNSICACFHDDLLNQRRAKSILPRRE